MAKKKAQKSGKDPLAKLKKDIRQEINSMHNETEKYIRMALNVVKKNPKGKGVARIKKRIMAMGRTMDDMEKFYTKIERVR